MLSQLSALRHQMIVWGLSSALLFLDFYASNRLIIYLLPNFLSHRLVSFLEGAVLAISFANAIYCFISYLSLVAKCGTKSTAQLPKKAPSLLSHLDSSATSAASPKKSPHLGADRATCLSSISTFLDNFFKASVSKPTELSSPMSASFSAPKDASLSSTIGYHDSPLNRSVSSIYTQQQLDKLLSEESCQSIIENSSTNIFANSFCDEDRSYKVGTTVSPPEKTDDAVNQVKQFMLSKQTRSSPVTRSISDLFKRTRESSPANISSLATSGASGKQRHHEGDLDKMFNYYSIDYAELEEYELKLRIWMCNTILRPLTEKIDKVNTMLSEKFASLHLKIGSTSPDALKANLSTRMELCNSYLPFILPYLRIHHNQNYLVQRIRALSDNVALENFKWNGGGVEQLHDETDGLSKSVAWSKKLPTDSKILWLAFCTYMDYLLSPCANYISGDFFKPFSNVYYLKSDVQPTALHTAPDAFFIRMVTEYPTVFEFILNGGNDVIVPCKESGNIWLVLIFFIAHVNKFNFSRIGNLNLSNISLDIFDN